MVAPSVPDICFSGAVHLCVEPQNHWHWLEQWFCFLLSKRLKIAHIISELQVHSVFEIVLPFYLAAFITYAFIAVIQEESFDSRAEVKAFDHGKLKHVETEEKNPLPTPQTLKEEMRPESLPDVSEVSKFDASKLKRVDTVEKNELPTAEGELNYPITNDIGCENECEGLEERKINYSILSKESWQVNI